MHACSRKLKRKEKKIDTIWLKKDIRINHKVTVGNNYLFLKFSPNHFNLFSPDLFTVGYMVLIVLLTVMTKKFDLKQVCVVLLNCNMFSNAYTTTFYAFGGKY